MVKTQFDYNIVYENDCYTVYKYDNPIGYFYLKLDHINEGTWFDPTDIKNGLRCGTVNMSIQKKTITNNEIVLLWHEIGHAIDHIENDLDTVAHDLWELKAIEFEQRAAELYNIDRSFSIKRDIGIGLIDLNLHTAGYITEEFVIDLVESVQNLLSVNYSMDDFDHIIEGQYAGVYYGYSFARYLFEQGFDYELYKGLA
jgi:Zn-dependent oligopeptidase